jgi:FlaG/FlaF family flagellin (archaellin)
VIFIAEGKKLGALYQDCRAVSEVYGQMLMISIVVLAFSGIAMTVYSDGGFVKPEHTPHIDLTEKIDTGPNTIQIVHSGGETIDLDEIKVVLYVKSPNQPEFKQIFDMSDPLIAKDPLIIKVFDPDGNSRDISTNKVISLGDCIVIYTNSNKLKVENRRDLNNEDLVSMFIIDIPSQQVIQKAVLQGGSWKLPNWITPHPYGSVFSSTNVWMPTESVAEINDGSLTKSTIPKNDWVYEDYTFGVDADEIGIPSSFKTFLRIIYQIHDCSPGTLTLNISTGSEWIQIAPKLDSTPKILLPETYNTVQDCVNANGGPGDITGLTTGETTYDITPYVKTIDDLERLKVRFSFKGNADINSGKIGCVDFVGIHVEPNI